MSNLIIIDGTSGIWKDDLVGYITDTLVDSTLIMKKTTRSKEEYDLRLDLQFVSRDEFDQYNYEYTYKYNKESYGFSKTEVENALLNYRNTFVIVRNVDVIERLCNDFENNNIIKVFIYTDAQKIAKRMKIKNDSVLNMSINQALDDYLRNPEIYDLVLINGATKNDFCRLVNYAIMFAGDKYHKEIKFTLKRKQKIIINIVLPIIDAFLTGIAVNSITSIPINQWNIICFCLSLLQIICLIIFQCFINK